MSSADFKKAQDRVEQAKQDILWLLSFLNDPNSSLKGYRLTKLEKEKLSRECLATLIDIQTAVAQVPSKKSHRKVEHTFKETIENTGAQETVSTTTETVSVQVESTRKDTAETDLAGAIPPWEDEVERAPNITPWED